MPKWQDIQPTTMNVAMIVPELQSLASFFFAILSVCDLLSVAAYLALRFALWYKVTLEPHILNVSAFNPN